MHHGNCRKETHQIHINYYQSVSMAPSGTSATKVVIHIRRSHIQGPSFLSEFNQTKIFSTDFRNQPPTTVKFHETPSSGGTELFHVDRRIDRQTWYNSYSLYQNFRTRQKHPTTVSQFLTGNFTKILLIIQIQTWKSIYSFLWSKISYGSIWTEKTVQGPSMKIVRIELLKNIRNRPWGWGGDTWKITLMILSKVVNKAINQNCRSKLLQLSLTSNLTKT